MAKNIIRQTDLVRELKCVLGNKITQIELTRILSALEEIVNQNLMSATVDKPVTIKLFKGLQLTSSILPDGEITIDGKRYPRSKRLRIGAKWTRHAKDRLNQI